MAGQFFEQFVRLFRMRDLHQLHLVELVLADHAAGVLAVRTRLAAETWRVANEFQRQVCQRDDFVAHDIRDRHFSGGNQVELPAVAARH